jgi:voltage-gated potassium channel
VEELKKRFLLPIVLLACLTLIGTFGFMLIEGWSFFDSIYMTIITVTTVGYREIHPLSAWGRVFTMALSIFGVGLALFLLATWMGFVFEGRLMEVFGRRKMEKMIEKLRDHYIVCGYGRMGRVVASELLDAGVDFVVIEKDREVIAKSEGNYLFYYGDATDDAVLKAVGIERAKKLISVLPSDADNLFVVLSARRLNPRLVIVSRAEQEGSEIKMLSAGADRVISAYTIGGRMLAHTALKPTVVDFLSLATTRTHIDLQIEELVVGSGSRMDGVSLGESGIGKELGVIVVAIKKEDGKMVFNPGSTTVVEGGDTLVVMGESAKLKLFEDYVR